MAQPNYLQSLTPEILQALARGQPYTTPDGYYFAPRLETTYNGEDNANTQQTGYYGGYLDPTDYTLNHLRPYGIYDQSGKLTGQGAWSQTNESDLEFFAPALLAAAAGVGASFLGPGAAAGGGASGLYTVPTAAEMAAGNAAFAESLSPYLAKGVPQMMGTLELIPESAMPVAPTGYTGPTFGGVSTLLNGGATKAATSMIPGVSDKLLGAGLTAAGALAGKEGTPGQTSERKMDPRLDNYVFGQNGVVPMAAGLLSQQMPMAQQGGQQAFDFGRGLLGRGVAANPFMR